MKKILYIAGVLLGGSLYAQINVPSNPNVSISGQNPFLDASGYNDFPTSEGKGLLFPSTDLRNFEFNTEVLDGFSTFTTAYDGMIVYNTATGSTGSNAAKQGIKVDVTPGFYYFFNPSDVNQGGTSVEKGKWVRIGGGSSSSSAEVVKGTFTNPGTNTVKIAKPDGFVTLASIKMYRKSGDTGTKHLVGTSLYSYEEVTEASGETNLKLVFGNGVISTAYPKGEYEYELEYIKQ